MPGVGSISWLKTRALDDADGQYDLFCRDEDHDPFEASSVVSEPRLLGIGDMTDSELCASIAGITLGDAAEILGEVARRRLASALPPLAALIRRFKGFETRRPFIEQAEALRALVAIGGDEAGAVLRLAIERGEFNRANLGTALRAAADLGIRLGPGAVEAALSHEEAEIRLAACALVTARPRLIAALVERLGDRFDQVRIAAACALGDLGRIEARAKLMDLLQMSPSVAVIQAAANIADEPIVVELGRLARKQARFKQPVAQALEDCKLELAAKLRRNLLANPPETVSAVISARNHL